MKTPILDIKTELKNYWIINTHMVNCLELFFKAKLQADKPHTNNSAMQSIFFMHVVEVPDITPLVVPYTA